MHNNGSKVSEPQNTHTEVPRYASHEIGAELWLLYEHVKAIFEGGRNGRTR